MSDASTLPRMTVEEFVTWSEGQPGRYELYLGEVITMQSERVSHAVVKLSVSIALRSAVNASGVDCLVLPDGITVRIDEHMAFEPDALVNCGPIAFEGVYATNPVVVVEVISPTTSRIDTGRKFANYFRIPSIQHYVIVQSEQRVVIHHRRNGDEIAWRILGHGPLTLDPPGITVQVDDFFADLPPMEEG